MKKKVLTKVVGIILAAVCVLSTAAAVTVCTAAADTNTDSTYSSAGDTKPTCNKEPGIYPIDADHFLIVYEDHTFALMHGEPPTHKPWTIA